MTVQQAVELVAELRRAESHARINNRPDLATAIRTAIDYIEENEERMDDARDAFRALIGMKKEPK